jgi:hypothetical protein
MVDPTELCVTLVEADHYGRNARIMLDQALELYSADADPSLLSTIAIVQDLLDRVAISVDAATKLARPDDPGCPLLAKTPWRYPHLRGPWQARIAKMAPKHPEAAQPTP